MGSGNIARLGAYTDFENELENLKSGCLFLRPMRSGNHARPGASAFSGNEEVPLIRNVRITFNARVLSELLRKCTCLVVNN